MSKKNKKPQAAKFSPKSYLKERGRKLPLGQCLINDNWEEMGMAHIFVNRTHVNGNVTFGSYLVDIFERGLKDSYAQVNQPVHILEEILEKYPVAFVEIEYALAHNIIYGGLEFSKEQGYPTQKDFIWTQFVLEEDTDEIPFMEIGFGSDEALKTNEVDPQALLLLNIIDLVYGKTFTELPEEPAFLEARVEAFESAVYRTLEEPEVEKLSQEVAFVNPYMDEYDAIYEDDEPALEKLNKLQHTLEEAIQNLQAPPIIYDMLSNIFIEKKEGEKACEVIALQMNRFPEENTSNLYGLLKFLDLEYWEKAEELLTGVLDIQDFAKDRRELTEFEACLFYTLQCKRFMKQEAFGKAGIYYDFVRKMHLDNPTLLSQVHLDILMEYATQKRLRCEAHYGKSMNEILQLDEIRTLIQDKL